MNCSISRVRQTNSIIAWVRHTHSHGDVLKYLLPLVQFLCSFQALLECGRVSPVICDSDGGCLERSN